MSQPATTLILSHADRDWFGQQVEALLPELFGAALRLCRDRTNAEDLVADTVVKALAALPTLQDRGAFRGWIFRILGNTFVSQCRRAEAKVVHEPVEQLDEPSFSLFERLHQPILLWWGNPELDFLNRLLRADLERAIDALPEVFRETVVMVDVQGLAYREVAALLDIPVGTVRSRLARGRALLQEKLWEHALDAGLTEAPRAQNGETDDRDP
jgi:RNA polymerase sigma-70 factor, ECF subfamily